MSVLHGEMVSEFHWFNLRMRSIASLMRATGRVMAKPYITFATGTKTDARGCNDTGFIEQFCREGHAVIDRDPDIKGCLGGWAHRIRDSVGR